MPLSVEEIEALVKAKTRSKIDRRPAYIRQLEDPEELETERLARIRERYPIRHQLGPVHWHDDTANCANRGCTISTAISVQGIRRCPPHAIQILNSLLVDKGILS